MATKNRTTNLMVMMPVDTLEEIESFQYDNRIKTRSKAIRKLIQIGLDDSKED